MLQLNIIWRCEHLNNLVMVNGINIIVKIYGASVTGLYCELYGGLTMIPLQKCFPINCFW